MNYTYLKDFICAAILVLLFQYINYSYLDLFKAKNWENLETEALKIEKVEENLLIYKKINSWGTAFSIPYFISLACRLIFNLQSKKQLPYDIWLIADVVAGVTNIIAF